MKQLLTIVFLFCFPTLIIAQKPNGQIEVTPFLRWDKYPEFSYAINPVNSNSVKISGTSWGVNVAYRTYFMRKMTLKFGCGYYRHSFNKIRQTNSLGGTSNDRVVENYSPPGGVTPGLTYTTDKYWYNTISLNVGVEKEIDLTNTVKLNVGTIFSNYLSFSQNYHITYPAPSGDDFKKNSKRYFGLSSSIYASVQKKYKKVAVGPEFLLPIYDYWRKDNTFPQEENNTGRAKWLNGVGVGICFTYFLK